MIHLLLWLSIVINEVIPAPSSGPEWVELYNTGDTTIDVSGWRIDDDTPGGVITTIAANTSIAPHQLLAIPLTTAILNNTGDAVVLLDSSGAQIDRIDFGAMKSGESMARVPDGSIMIVKTQPSMGQFNGGETATATATVTMPATATATMTFTLTTTPTAAIATIMQTTETATTQIIVVPSMTSTQSPTKTPTPSHTRTITPTASASDIALPSATASQTILPTATTNTPSATHTVAQITTSPSRTQTASRTPSLTRTASMTRTFSLTRTPSDTHTPSLTRTPSDTHTPSSTKTPSLTRTPSDTHTPSRTKTPSPSKTPRAPTLLRSGGAPTTAPDAANMLTLVLDKASQPRLQVCVPHPATLAGWYLSDTAPFVAGTPRCQTVAFDTTRTTITLTNPHHLQMATLDVVAAWCQLDMSACRPRPTTSPAMTPVVAIWRPTQPAVATHVHDELPDAIPPAPTPAPAPAPWPWGGIGGSVAIGIGVWVHRRVAQSHARVLYCGTGDDAESSINGVSSESGSV